MAHPARPPVPRREELLGETVEDVDELVQLFAALDLALCDAIAHAVVDMMLEDCQADSIQRRLGRGQLLENLHAEPRFLDHPADAPDLALNPIESRDERLLFRCSKHQFFLFHGAWTWRWPAGTHPDLDLYEREPVAVYRTARRNRRPVPEFSGTHPTG